MTNPVHRVRIVPLEEVIGDWKTKQLIGEHGSICSSAAPVTDKPCHICGAVQFGPVKPGKRTTKPNWVTHGRKKNG